MKAAKPADKTVARLSPEVLQKLDQQRAIELDLLSKGVHVAAARNRARRLLRPIAQYCEGLRTLSEQEVATFRARIQLLCDGGKVFGRTYP